MQEKKVSVALLAILLLLATTVLSARVVAFEEPLETRTFPIGTSVIPMDDHQGDRLKAFGFVHAILLEGITIFRIIEPPDVNLKTSGTPGGDIYAGGPILVEDPIPPAVTAAFPTVTVDDLIEAFTSDKVFRASEPTDILVIYGIYGDTDVVLDWMGIPYDMTTTAEVEADLGMLTEYDVVVVDCPGWDSFYAGILENGGEGIPEDVASAIESFAENGGEVIFNDRSFGDLAVAFPGYVSVLENIDGTWDFDVHNVGEFPSQYYGPSPVPIYTMGAGCIVDQVLDPDVETVLDIQDYGGSYRVGAFYFYYGDGLVEGFAYHPQEQTGESQVLSACLYGNKFIHALPPPITGTIAKTVEPDSGYLGDILTVTLNVEVSHTLMMTVEDVLPSFLSYVLGTFSVDGVPVIPTVVDGVISTTVEGELEYEITFDVIIDSVGATIETGENWAYLYYNAVLLDDDCAVVTIYPYCGFHKVAELVDAGENDYIDLFEDVIWEFRIMVTNLFEWTMEDVLVTDRLGAELEVDDPPSPIFITPGTTADWSRKGNVKLTWTVGDLESGETAMLILQVSTREKNDKQAYTSEGCNYEFNSGATLKFLYELEPCLFIQLSAHTGPMLFDVPGEWPHFQPYCMLWPEGGTATVAFEDLPIGEGNDYDYNNFVSDVSVVGRYSEAGMAQLKFTFDAQARGAAYHHNLRLLIPASTFGSGGVYIMEFYETDGSFIFSTSGSFVDTADLDLTIFHNTWNALPPNPGQSWSGNTFDGYGLQPGRRTVVTLEFTTPFSFDLSTYTPDYVGVHGDNLFFDPYLYVWDTAEEIHITDPRLIVVPTDWEWPQETAAVWTVYPYNAGTSEGVTAGNPPTFTTYWYTETPTALKWTP